MSGLLPCVCPKCLNSNPERIKVWAEVVERPQPQRGIPGKAKRIGWECLQCGHRWEDD